MEAAEVRQRQPVHARQPTGGDRPPSPPLRGHGQQTRAPQPEPGVRHAQVCPKLFHVKTDLKL